MKNISKRCEMGKKGNSKSGEKKKRSELRKHAHEIPIRLRTDRLGGSKREERLTRAIISTKRVLK